MRRLSAFFVAVIVAFLSSAGTARAEDRNEAMQRTVKDYYDAEVRTSFLFVGYGAVTAGAGGAVLSEKTDFARGLGWSSVALGGATALGGAAYGIAAYVRGNYYESLALRDPARFKSEEADRIAGTNARFWLYLGSELLETAAGIGLAAYGFAAHDDLVRGIGTGAAIQGIGLFVIDVPGAGRASRYQEEVRRFEPAVAIDSHGFAASMRHSF